MSKSTDPKKSDFRDLFKYHQIFCDILRELGLDEEKGPVPLQAWEGIAQAVADYSGYRVSIQTTVLTPRNEAGYMHLIEYREVAEGQPTFLYKHIIAERTK